MNNAQPSGTAISGQSLSSGLSITFLSFRRMTNSTVDRRRRRKTPPPPPPPKKKEKRKKTTDCAAYQAMEWADSPSAFRLGMWSLNSTTSAARHKSGTRWQSLQPEEGKRLNKTGSVTNIWLFGAFECIPLWCEVRFESNTSVNTRKISITTKCESI